MAYNLRSKKVRLDQDDNNEKTEPEEDNSESESYSDSESEDSFIEDDDTTLRDQIINKLLENTYILNPYNVENYEKMDAHYINTFIKEDKNIYKDKVKHLRQIQIDGYVTLEEIVDANIPDYKKAELMLLHDQLKQLQYFQDEFIFINKKIKKTIEYYKEAKSVFVDDEKEIMSKIKTAPISEYNREKLLRKLFSLQKCESTEKHELLSYIEYGLKIVNVSHPSPYASTTDYSLLATTIKEQLDSALFGQDKAKEEIIDNVICRLINPEIGNITVFSGPPGVGKTHMARRLAGILGYKFYQISLGAVNDAYSITGSLSTYIGSRPGEIYNAIREMGCDNGIIFLDEFDKIFDTSRNTTNSNLENVFLNILDPTQNSNYKDNHLFDLNIDLSKIWFIISVNNIDHIRGPIKDRLRPIISFAPYTLDNKISILKQFIIRDTMSTYKIDSSKINISDDAYKMMCDTKDPGIREVKNTCELLLKRVNTLILTSYAYKPTYFITFKHTIDGKIIITTDVVKKLTDYTTKEKEEKYLSFYS